MAHAARRPHRPAAALFVVAFAILAWSAHAADTPKPRPARSAPVATAPSPCPSPCPTPAPPRAPEAQRELAVKWVRDSAEYQALAGMVYAFAAHAVEKAAEAQPAPGAQPASVPAVVLDVDETALDNSTYQLERAAYGMPFTPDSWSAWVRRRAAGVVPGVAEFLRDVRARGVRVAWISNRETALAADTRANLEARGLWDPGDRLCLRPPDRSSKRPRRAELREGRGECAFERPARVLAYLGDQMGDFPEDGEEGGDYRRADGFGRTLFLLPDPMYGDWTDAVTRSLP